MHTIVNATTLVAAQDLKKYNYLWSLCLVSITLKWAEEFKETSNVKID
jgi:hypothetical protein